MGTAIKHPIPEKVKPSFVIFDIRAPERQDVKNYKWRLNQVWHMLLCSCTNNIATVGVNGLSTICRLGGLMAYAHSTTFLFVFLFTDNHKKKQTIFSDHSSPMWNSTSRHKTPLTSRPPPCRPSQNFSYRIWMMSDSCDSVKRRLGGGAHVPHSLSPLVAKLWFQPKRQKRLSSNIMFCSTFADCNVFVHTAGKYDTIR